MKKTLPNYRYKEPSKAFVVGVVNAASPGAACASLGATRLLLLLLFDCSYFFVSIVEWLAHTVRTLQAVFALSQSSRVGDGGD